MSLPRKFVLAVAGVLAVMAVAILIWAGIGRGLAQAGLWSAPVGAVAAVVAAVAAIWPLIVRPPKAPVPAGVTVPGWVVDRPAELAAVVTALRGGRGRTVGITTGLHGAGGFGKTTLALMVCADRKVRRRFRGHVDLVTVGRDVQGSAAVAAKVNEVIKLISGEDATFPDPEIAGRKLGALLDTGPRRLLVLDDVWGPGQLAPFMVGGKRCARLVTTRVPGLLAGRGVEVRVDQMSPVQARVLLLSGLPPLDPVLVAGLLAVTGRWPLLMGLVNKILANAARAGADVPAVGAQLLEQLHVRGPAVVDDVSGASASGLAVGQPRERVRAVGATIGASTGLLGADDAQRFAELGVFAEDEAVPFSLVALLWRATGSLDELRSTQVLARLAELGLVSFAGNGAGAALHDVIRDFVRAELGPQQLAALNNMLLDAVAAHLPAADLPGTAARGRDGVAWWEQNRTDQYLWDHLIEHLLDAGRLGEAEAVAGDLRWVAARLQASGPAAPAADLDLVGTPRAARMGQALARIAHLLAPTDPPRSVVDVLHSRVAGDPDWGPQAASLRDRCHWPRLVSYWLPPDLPDPALRRVLTVDHRWMGAVAGGPPAYVEGDGLIARLRNVFREVAARHRDKGISGLAVAQDGSWLAASSGRKVWIWDLASGQVQATLTVGIWDVAERWDLAALPGLSGGVSALAAVPGGSWPQPAAAAGRCGSGMWQAGGAVPR